MFDEVVKTKINRDKNFLVPFYLMAAYAYYKEDNPILSDGLFDDMSKQLMEHYDEITHPHKDKISYFDLAAGTFLGEYPLIIQGALHSFRDNYAYNESLS